MVDSILFDRAVDVMHKTLNISSERNRLITSNIDQEITNPAESNIKYRTSSEMLMRKLNLIKYSITEGGK